MINYVTTKYNEHNSKIKQAHYLDLLLIFTFPGNLENTICSLNLVHYLYPSISLMKFPTLDGPYWQKYIVLQLCKLDGPN